MTRIPFTTPLVAVSVKVYRALLVAYPTAFQKEYGPEMMPIPPRSRRNMVRR
jgi:hypothetical protein